MVEKIGITIIIERESQDQSIKNERRTGKAGSLIKEEKRVWEKG